METLREWTFVGSTVKSAVVAEGLTSAEGLTGNAVSRLWKKDWLKLEGSEGQ